MAIKCNCPQRCEIHPNGGGESKAKPVLVPAVPVIDAADQLQFKRLENTWMEARLKVSEAQTQLEMFGATMFQKYGVDGKELTLDPKGPAFSPRKG